jgi:hypothetical protein
LPTAEQLDVAATAESGVELCASAVLRTATQHTLTEHVVDVRRAERIEPRQNEISVVVSALQRARARRHAHVAAQALSQAHDDVDLRVGCTTVVVRATRLPVESDVADVVAVSVANVEILNRTADTEQHWKPINFDSLPKHTTAHQECFEMHLH